MKIASVFLVAIGMMFLFSCDELLNENFVGKGPKVKRTLKVESFNGLIVANAMSVFIQQGAEQKVVIEGNANILDKIDAKSEGGRLEIQLEKGNYKNCDVNIYITIPSINYIAGSGATSIELAHFDKLNKLELDFSGATEFTAVGKQTNVSKLKVDISGAGEIKAFQLKCKKIDIDLSGASECELNATESLNLDISGASEVRYLGKPKVTQDISGSSTVVGLD